MNGIITGFLVGFDKLKDALICVNGSFNADLTAKRFGIYGLFSKPLIKTKTTILKSGIKNIIISEENPQLKIELSDGEVALHDGINTIHLKRAGGIEIKSAGNITIGGSGAKKLLTETFLTLFDTHTHGSPAGATTPPTVPLSPNATVKTLFTEAL